MAVGHEYSAYKRDIGVRVEALSKFYTKTFGSCYTSNFRQSIHIYETSIHISPRGTGDAGRNPGAGPPVENPTWHCLGNSNMEKGRKNMGKIMRKHGQINEHPRISNREFRDLEDSPPRHVFSYRRVDGIENYFERFMVSHFEVLKFWMTAILLGKSMFCF